MCLKCGRPGFDPWVGKIPWRRERLPTPGFWPGEFHGLYIVHGVAKSRMQLLLSSIMKVNTYKQRQNTLTKNEVGKKSFMVPRTQQSPFKTLILLLFFSISVSASPPPSHLRNFIEVALICYFYILLLDREIYVPLLFLLNISGTLSHIISQNSQALCLTAT